METKIIRDGVLVTIDVEDDIRTSEDIENDILALKAELTSLDYKTIKRLQGVLSDEEWEQTKAECAALRGKINELEAELAEMEEI